MNGAEDARVGGRMRGLALDIQEVTDRIPDDEVYHLCDMVLLSVILLEEMDEDVQRPDQERTMGDLTQSMREYRCDVRGGPSVVASLQAATCALSMGAELLLHSYDEAREVLAGILTDVAADLVARVRAEP